MAEGVGERDCSRSSTSTSSGRLEGSSAADVTPTTPLALEQPLRSVLQPSDDDSMSTTKLDEKRKKKGVQTLKFRVLTAHVAGRMGCLGTMLYVVNRYLPKVHGCVTG